MVNHFSVIGGEGGSIKISSPEHSPGNWLLKKSINKINFDISDEDNLPKNGEVQKAKSHFPSGNEADSWKKQGNYK